MVRRRRQLGDCDERRIWFGGDVEGWKGRGGVVFELRWSRPADGTYWGYAGAGRICFRTFRVASASSRIDYGDFWAVFGMQVMQGRRLGAGDLGLGVGRYQGGRW